MNIRNSLLISSMVLVGALAQPAMYPSVPAGEVARSSIEKAVDAGFTELERQLVEKYFGKMPASEATDEVAGADEDGGGAGKDKKGKKDKHSGKDKGLPPGLAKRDSLPPGLAKRETLPPGLEKRNLPADLEEQLPPAPEGYERRVVGNAAVVLIDKATGKVADMITDILIPAADD